MNLEKHLTFHFQIHTKPRSETEFGYFLAGLVDADGHFAKDGSLQISFNGRDLSVALYLKHILGGDLYTYKKTCAYRLTFNSHKSKVKIYSLLNHKLALKAKLDHFNTRFVSKLNLPQACGREVLSLKDHYIAGFLQGDGSFQIKIKPPHARSKKYQVELRVDFEQKPLCVLKKIQAVFGGSLGYRAKRNTYTFTSVNLSRAQAWRSYLKNYPPLGSSLRLNLIWNLALSLVLSKAHLTSSGLVQIRKLKHSLSVCKQSQTLRLKPQVWL